VIIEVDFGKDGAHAIYFFELYSAQGVEAMCFVIDLRELLLEHFVFLYELLVFLV
jgi:hypothetical protein